MPPTLEKLRRANYDKAKAERRTKALERLAESLDADGRLPTSTVPQTATETAPPPAEAPPPAPATPQPDMALLALQVNLEPLERLEFLYQLLQDSRAEFGILKRAVEAPLGYQFHLVAEAAKLWTQQSLADLKDFAKHRGEGYDFDSIEARLLKDERQLVTDAEHWANAYYFAEFNPAGGYVSGYPELLRQYDDNIRVHGWKVDDGKVDPFSTRSEAEQEKRKSKLQSQYLKDVGRWADGMPTTCEHKKRPVRAA